MSGYLSYLRPAAASTSCVERIELSGTEDGLQLTALTSLALGSSECLGASTVTLDFVPASENTDTLKILLDDDNDETTDSNFYITSSAETTIVNFDERLFFSGAVYTFTNFLYNPDNPSDPNNDYYPFTHTFDVDSGKYILANPDLADLRVTSRNSGPSSIYFLDSVGSNDLEIDGLNLERSSGIATSSFSSVSISHLDLRSTRFAYGSALRTQSMNGLSTNIIDSVFYGNFAADGAFSTSGTATVSTSEFRYNSSDSNYSRGGAISVYGSAAVSDSTFFGNNSLYASGGAINLLGGTDGSSDRLLVERSSFEYNSGAIGGGAIYSLNAELEVVDSVFIDNRADSGGAILQTNTGTSSASFSSRSSSFSSNSARDGSGGAISSYGAAEMSVEGSTFIQNVQRNPTSPGASGGAIDVQAFGSLLVSNSTFIQNQSIGDPDYAAGGAIFADYSSSPSDVSVSVTSSTFIGNSSPARQNSYSGEVLEGQSVHLYSPTQSTEDFIFLGNIFVSDRSITRPSGNSHIMAGGSGVYDFRYGQYENPYYGVSATRVVAEFNISDDSNLSHLSSTNNERATLDDLAFGGLVPAIETPQSRSILSGSIADNFVSKSDLEPNLRELLPLFDQQGSIRGLSVLDAGAFERIEDQSAGGGSAGGGSAGGAVGGVIGGAPVLNAGESLLTPIKFSSSRISMKQRALIRKAIKANPLTKTVACKPFVTKAQNAAERRAARAMARAVCNYVEKCYPEIFVKVEPLGVVKKSDPKNRRVQLRLG